MLGDVGLLPVGLRPAAGEQPPPDVGDPERVDEPDERVVPRRRATATWNARLASCAAAAVRAASARRRPRAGARRDRSSVAPLGREPRDGRLEEEARLEALEDAARGRRSATKKPRLTSNSTSPSPASRRSASRTEPREMPSASASSAWPIRAPGASRPSTIIARSSSYASPTTERTRSGGPATAALGIGRPKS